MTTLHLYYAEEQQLACKQVIEELGGRAQEIGVDLRTVDFGKSDTKNGSHSGVE